MPEVNGENTSPVTTTERTVRTLTPADRVRSDWRRVGGNVRGFLRGLRGRAPELNGQSANGTNGTAHASEAPHTNGVAHEVAPPAPEPPPLQPRTYSESSRPDASIHDRTAATMRRQQEATAAMHREIAERTQAERQQVTEARAQRVSATHGEPTAPVVNAEQAAAQDAMAQRYQERAVAEAQAAADKVSGERWAARDEAPVTQASASDQTPAQAAEAQRLSDTRATAETTRQTQETEAARQRSEASHQARLTEEAATETARQESTAREQERIRTREQEIAAQVQAAAEQARAAAHAAEAARQAAPQVDVPQAERDAAQGAMAQRYEARADAKAQSTADQAIGQRWSDRDENQQESGSVNPPEKTPGQFTGEADVQAAHDKRQKDAAEAQRKATEVQQQQDRVAQREAMARMQARYAADREARAMAERRENGQVDVVAEREARAVVDRINRGEVSDEDRRAAQGREAIRREATHAARQQEYNQEDDDRALQARHQVAVEQQNVQEKADSIAAHERAEAGQVDTAATRQAAVEVDRINSGEISAEDQTAAMDREVARRAETNATRAAEDAARDAAEKARTQQKEAVRAWVAQRVPLIDMPREEVMRLVAERGLQVAKSATLGAGIGAGVYALGQAAGVDTSQYGTEFAMATAGLTRGVIGAVDQARVQDRALKTEMTARRYDQMVQELFGKDPGNAEVQAMLAEINSAGSESRRKGIIRDALKERGISEAPNAMVDKYAVIYAGDKESRDAWRNETKVSWKDRIKSWIPGKKKELAGQMVVSAASAGITHGMLDFFFGGQEMTLTQAPSTSETMDTTDASTAGTDTPGPSGSETTGAQPETAGAAAATGPEANGIFATMPTVEQDFLTVDAAGNNEAKLSGWVQAEAVKAYKDLVLHQAPTFDMNGDADLALLQQIESDPRLAELFSTNGSLREQMAQAVLDRNIGTHPDVSAIMNGTSSDGEAVLNDIGFPVGSEKYTLPDIKAVMKTLLENKTT